MFLPLKPNTVGIADTDIKVLFAENSELSHVLSLKPGVGQNIVVHASFNIWLLIYSVHFSKARDGYNERRN